MTDNTKLALGIGLGAGLFWLLTRAQSDQQQAQLSTAEANLRAVATGQRVGGGSSTQSTAPPSRIVAMREAFHLRPRATAESIGPELPAGTEVEVGRATTITRTIGGRTETLFAVRLADNRQGYAFLQADLAARFLPASTSKPLEGFGGVYFPAEAIAGAGVYARRF